MRTPLIAPSILAADFTKLGDEIRSVVAAGADWIHIDVMDGHFVPPITFGDVIVKASKAACSLPLDVHLMVSDPEGQIEPAVSAGASNITFHYEATPHAHRLLTHIKGKGITAGIALNPSTPVSMLEPIIDDIDLILIMTINPGWSGQKFLPLSEAKIRDAAALIKKSGKNIRLEVDGGIDPVTSRIVQDAGADVLVSASAIFHSKDYGAAIKAIRKG